MISSAITVSTTPVLLVAETANATRTIYLHSIGKDIHLGGDSVTTASGLLLEKDTTVAFTIPPLNALYAVVDTGTHICTVLKPEGDF